MSEPPFGCPVCGTEHPHQSERYRNHLCARCEARARCSHGRVVGGHNTSPMGGGFAARHADGGREPCDQVSADGRVWVEGRELRMQEARFGGVVTVQLRRLVPIAETVVWSRSDGVDWTSAGVPRPWAGFVAGRTPPRRRLRRATAPREWEWMVRDTAAHTVRARGVAGTPDQARARVVEVLDEIRRVDPSYV